MILPTFALCKIYVLTKGDHTIKAPKDVARTLRDEHGFTIVRQLPGVEIKYKSDTYYIELPFQSVEDALAATKE